MSHRHPNDPAQRGLLVYAAIGDAYGMAYEFVDDYAKVGPNDLTYKPNPKFPEYQKGRYTDDTQLQWINGEMLLHHAPHTLKPEYFADAWVFEYHQDPRPGYTRFFRQAMDESANGADLMRRIDNTKSTASGAAMRAPVIGLLPDVNEVKRIAAMQARVTHDNPTGILSAQAAALAVHGLHYNRCAKADLVSYIDSQIGTAWRTLDDNNDPKNGLYIVKKAIGAVMAHDGMADILRACVDCGPGQDTDTLGALAMSIASRSREITDDLPDSLFSELETAPEQTGEKKRGDYGRDFLEKLDQGLLRRFPPLAPRPAFPFSPGPG